LKRAEFANIDIDLLRLKRDTLRERLEDLEKELAAAAKLAKGNKAGELADRGLGGSTIIDSFTMGIERDANDQLAVARREYNRAIEEIALMERRIVEGRVPWWKRLWNCLRGR